MKARLFPLKALLPTGCPGLGRPEPPLRAAEKEAAQPIPEPAGGAASALRLACQLQGPLNLEKEKRVFRAVCPG